MIIAIPSSSDKKDARIDDRFGRCPFFCFYNIVTKDYEFRENRMKDLAEGAGRQVAEFLASCGISEVYACEFGPKARTMLEKLNVGMKLVERNQTIGQIVSMLNS